MNNEQFDDLMSAATFAQAGEHEEALKLMRGRDIVLLAVSDVYFDTSVFSYALNICKRTGAGLAILYLTRTELHKHDIQEFMARASREGIACSVSKTDGCMKQAILDFTKKNKSIMFVVVGTTPELDIECKSGEKSLSDAWKRLRCPLVLVSKGDMPSFA
ncbi:MAG: hypothetical protein HZA15_00015 [Nitrospirae bacterium]|nr:hypothetical protein [Nitrospirota bacterium]